MEIIAVFHKPDGTLVKQSSADNPAGPEASLKSHHQVVAVFVRRPNPTGPPDFWDEYSTNSLHSVQENPDGCAILTHDSLGQGTTRLRQYNFDDTVEAQRQIDNKVAKAAAGRGANWDVLDDGTGTFYDQKLAEARTLAGFGT